MNTIIVWLLISISNKGDLHTVERFPTEADCIWVAQNLKNVSNYGIYNQDAKCIKAKIAVVK